MKRFGAGQYDQRITFTRPTVTGQDSFGADVAGTPTDLGTYWARAEYGAGREFQRAHQRWAEVVVVFLMRRQAEVTLATDDVVTWNDEAFDIVDVRGPGTRDPEWAVAAKRHP